MWNNVYIGGNPETFMTIHGSNKLLVWLCSLMQINKKSHGKFIYIINFSTLLLSIHCNDSQRNFSISYTEKLPVIDSMKHFVNWTSSFKNLQNLKLIDIYSKLPLGCDLIVWDRISNAIIRIATKIV